MVTAQIGGKEFPLCLTVAALDKINEKIGGLHKLSDFLNGGKEADYEAMLTNTAWLLALLMKEGEENRQLYQHYFETNGAELDRRDIPDQAALSHILTIASATRLRTSVLAAVSESMSQEIQAVHDGKKKENVAELG